MNTPTKFADFGARVLMAAIFVLSGLSKLSHYAGTAAYMQSAGVPGALLPVVIAVELVGGAAIIAGLYTRSVAALLAIFSLVTAALFHANFADQVQSIMFLKNLAMAGGFLLLVARGPGDWSLDHRLTNR